MRRIKYVLLVFIVLVSMNTQSQNEIEISDERIDEFSKKMCKASLVYRTSAKTAGENIEEMMLSFLGTSKEDPKHKEILTKFWNEYNEKLICYEGPEDETRNPQHFLKRVVDLGMYSILYDFLLYDEDEYPIDVNAVEVYNGKEETLLDYMDAIIANPKNEEKYNMQEIKDLRGTIIGYYGAKKASELEN